MLTRIYKPGQGKNTRLWTGLGVGSVVGLGCYRLYELLGAGDLNLWVVSVVPVAVFVAVSIGLYWSLSKPAVADFLIAAEGELKKVSWSSRHEIAVSTLVVILVVVVMAVLLGTTDIVFQLVFSRLLG